LVPRCRPYRPEVFTELELVAVEAMSAVLGCGKIFDPTGTLYYILYYDIYYTVYYTIL